MTGQCQDRLAPSLACEYPRDHAIHNPASSAIWRTHPYQEETMNDPDMARDIASRHADRIFAAAGRPVTCRFMIDGETICDMPETAAVHHHNSTWCEDKPWDHEESGPCHRFRGEGEVGTASVPPVRTFRVRVLGLMDGDILHLHADGSLTLEIGTEVFRGAR